MEANSQAGSGHHSPIVKTRPRSRLGLLSSATPGPRARVLTYAPRVGQWGPAWCGPFNPAPRSLHWQTRDGG